MNTDSITTKGENTDLVFWCQSNFFKQMDSSVQLPVSSVNKTSCVTQLVFVIIENCVSLTVSGRGRNPSLLFERKKRINGFS